MNVIALGAIPGLLKGFEKNQNACRNFGEIFKKTCNVMMDFYVHRDF